MGKGVNVNAQLLSGTWAGKKRTNGLRSIWIKLKSELDFSNAKKNTRSARTVEHGTALVQRDVRGVVHVVRIRSDIFLVRDFCQTLVPSETSDRRRYFQTGSKVIPNRNADLDSAYPLGPFPVRECPPFPTYLRFQAMLVVVNVQRRPAPRRRVWSSIAAPRRGIWCGIATPRRRVRNGVTAPRRWVWSRITTP